MDADIRKAMRQAREESGLKWDRFACEARFSRSHLRAVENGTRAVNAEVARAYDRVLGTGTTFSAMLDGPRPASPWNRQGTLEILSDQARGGGVDRRSFVITSGAALAAILGHWRTAVSGQPGYSAAPAPVLHGRTPFGTSVLFDHIADRLDHLRHLDDELGSGQMARLARNELMLLTQLVNTGGMPEHAETRALSLAAEAARQTAWSLFDSHHPAAERYFETALRASATAGDVTAGAYAMSFQAVQHYTVGDPSDAVNLLTFAEESIAGKSTPRMRAMLAARKARALSKTGDRVAVMHALHHARDLLERGPHDDDPPVLYWVTLAEVEMIAGSSALEMHDPAAALRFFAAASDADYPGDQWFPRSHAIYLARAAEAHLALHDLDAAVACARHAARCLSTVDSARSDSALSGLRRKLVPHSSSRTVRDFLQGG